MRADGTPATLQSSELSMFLVTSALAPAVHRLPRYDDDTQRGDDLVPGNWPRVRHRWARCGDARGHHRGLPPARRDAAPRPRDHGLAGRRRDGGGQGNAEPRLSVACLDASYATGLGWSDATGEPSTEALVHGAADATLTAVKRLDGRPARLVLVVQTAARHARLGAAAREEWAAIRAQLDESTPCAGWQVEDVAAYGRGVQPVAAPGALVIVAIGDSPRSEAPRG